MQRRRINRDEVEQWNQIGETCFHDAYADFRASQGTDQSYLRMLQSSYSGRFDRCFPVVPDSEVDKYPVGDMFEMTERHEAHPRVRLAPMLIVPTGLGCTGELFLEPFEGGCDG